eukprot:3621614-Rhodomonas_salina.1
MPASTDIAVSREARKHHVHEAPQTIRFSAPQKHRPSDGKHRREMQRPLKAASCCYLHHRNPPQVHLHHVLLAVELLVPAQAPLSLRIDRSHL